MKKYILVLLALSLFQCSPPRLVTVNYKEFVPKHSEYIPTTQIVRGTIHMDVPTLFAFPDLYMVFTRTPSGQSVVYKVPETQFDSVKVGMNLTTNKNWKEITNRPYMTRDQVVKASPIQPPYKDSVFRFKGYKKSAIR